MNLKRPLYGPDDPRGPTRGRDVAWVLLLQRSGPDTNDINDPDPHE